MIQECPGSQRFKKPYPETFKCSRCGADVEIWSDEFSAPCPQCGIKVDRGAGGDQCCLDWCKSAKECVGEKIYKDYLKNRKK